MVGIDNDDPKALVQRRKVIESKPFLKAIYEEWYGMIEKAIPRGEGRILEIGSGGGFINDIVYDVVTSDISTYRELDVVFDASRRWPIKNDVLKTIILVHAFHHLPDVSCFLSNASETLCLGGKILLIEPWHNKWSRYVYDKLHNEPFVPDSADWNFRRNGPFSGSNQALPWIVFERDKTRFRKDFPGLAVQKIETLMPFVYLLSGGFTSRISFPGAMYQLTRRIEKLGQLEQKTAMFAFIEIEKTG
jgi:SAM-dependent methyltransferase